MRERKCIKKRVTQYIDGAGAGEQELMEQELGEQEMLKDGV